WLAICGIVPFSGFFSKDSIIAGAWATEAYGEHLEGVGKLLAVMLAVAALGTAFYMSRLYFLVFSGDKTRAPHDIDHHIHESPSVMVAPLVLRPLAPTLGGFIGLPGSLFGHPEWNWLAHDLETVGLHEVEVNHGLEILFMVLSTGLALVGIG